MAIALTPLCLPLTQSNFNVMNSFILALCLKVYRAISKSSWELIDFSRSSESMYDTLTLSSVAPEFFSCNNKRRVTVRHFGQLGEAFGPYQIRFKSFPIERGGRYIQYSNYIRFFIPVRRFVLPFEIVDDF